MRVQEALSSLQLPYLYVHAAMGSRKREEFYAKYEQCLSGPRRTMGLIQV